MPKVLISDALSPAAVQIFKDRGVEVDFQPNLGKDKDKLAEIIGDYRRPCHPLRHQGDAENPGERRSKLKVIGRAGIGVDNVDIPAATAQGHHRDEYAVRQFDHHRRTCDHADAGAGAADPAADASTQAGKWEKNRFMGVEITGKTLGVIGCGNIGSIVADRAHRPEDEGDRLRSVPVAGARASISASRRSSSTSCSGAPTSSPCIRRSPTRPRNIIDADSARRR